MKIGALIMENPASSAHLNPRCPWLPEVEELHDFSITRKHGDKKGEAFYLDALRYAQSQWMSGKPAQAILQLNKAWMADLSESQIHLSLPSPYLALLWMMKEVDAGAHGFMGNPVRHFQHLASRMSGPRSEIRTWRAWWCFHLAESVLETSRYPRDGRQIAREGLWIPGAGRALDEIARGGWQDEWKIAKAAW